MGDSRSAALSALEKCRRANAWSDAVLGSVMEREGLRGRDRALAAALCYGVLQNRILLDHLIGEVSSVPLRRIEPKVLDILRISAYQILFLDRVPAAAAVSEGVRICRASGCARAAGYVNAVLRKLSDGAIALPEGDSAEALSLRYSHPLWLVELYLARLGVAETAELLRVQNEAPPVVLQVNSLRTDVDALRRELEAAGASVSPHPYLPDCLLLSGGNPASLDVFRNGLCYVQDAAAKMAVLAAQPRPGMRILDVCAAPGGKSFAAAILGGNAVEIVSCDLHENKLKRIREGADRLGIGNIAVCAADARTFRPEYEARFDLILADVPCSGLGVIRKKPDIRYKDPAEFSGLPAVQSAILQNVSRYVAPGGALLYSTCTVRAEENEDVVSAFLDSDSGFAPEDFTLPFVGESRGGMLQLWPHRHGTDGFYIAKMRKTN